MCVIRIETSEVGQEGAGEVAVAKRNDSNDQRWHPTTTKEKEGQLSDVTWPPMMYIMEPDVDFALKVNFWWHFSQGAVHDHRTLKTLLYFHKETEKGR